MMDRWMGKGTERWQTSLLTHLNVSRLLPCLSYLEGQNKSSPELYLVWVFFSIVTGNWVIETHASSGNFLRFWEVLSSQYCSKWAQPGIIHRTNGPGSSHPITHSMNIPTATWGNHHRDFCATNFTEVMDENSLQTREYCLFSAC